KGQKGVRNTPPLFNLAWNPRLFWDGRAQSIEDQVFHPVTAVDEMDMTWTEAAERIAGNDFYPPLFRAAFGSDTIDSSRIAAAIAQFERSIISAGSRYDQAIAGTYSFTEDEFEGFNLVNNMTRGDCLQCHTTDGN